MKKTQGAIRRHFHRHTQLSPVCHDFEPDEKRLKSELYDDRLRLRWNVLIGKAQVWYDAPSGLYCVMNVDAPYSVEKVIGILRRRQREKRRLAKEYKDLTEGQEKESDAKIADVSNHVADAFGDWAVGKVTTSGKGLARKEE